MLFGLGAVAHLGERRLCKAEVGGSSPPSSTTPPSYQGRHTALCPMSGDPSIWRNQLDAAVPQLYSKNTQSSLQKHPPSHHYGGLDTLIAGVYSVAYGPGD